MRTADKFTVVRVLFAPIFFALYQLSVFWNGKNEAVSLGILVFLVAALAFAEFTDFLDGFFARKFGEVSDFGKLFDPFADALLHITTFFCFTLHGFMPQIAFILIFWREFAQMFLRMVSIKSGYAIAARNGGKLKTVIYIVSGFVVLILQIAVKTGLLPDTARVIPVITLTLFSLCVILSYVSFIDYLIVFKSKISGNGTPRP